MTHLSRSSAQGAALLLWLATLASGQITFPPQITSPSSSPATLPPGVEGTAYSFTFTATGGITPYAWSASTNLPPWLNLNSSSGVLSGTPPVNSFGTYGFTVFVVDSQKPPQSASVQCTIQITAPIQPFSITTKSVPPGTAGSPYPAFSFTAANGMPPFTWSLSPGTALPSGLGFTAAGVLSGSLRADSAGTYIIAVSVMDSQKAAASAQFTLLINPPAASLSITTPSLPDGSVGVAYSQDIRASGGVPPYHFAIVQTAFGANAPPPGLTMSASGTLAGIPTKSGTYRFYVTVNDSVGNQVNSATYSVTITPQLVITTMSLPPGSLGVGYTQTIAATGGTGAYTFSLPTGSIPGLTLSPNGILSGIPAVAGKFSITVQVADTAGVSVTQTYPVTITAAPPALQVSAQALSFTSFLGGDAPLPQAFPVLSTGSSAVFFSIVVDGGTPNTPVPASLTVKPVRNLTPASVTVSLNPDRLPAGSYSARIRVTAPRDPTQSPIDIPVSFTVSAAPPLLDVAPGFLRFAGRVQAPGTFEQALVVRNAGGNGPLGFAAAIVGRSPWVRVTPAASQAGPNAPVFLRVQVNTAGLAVGSYRDVIRIVPTPASAGSQDVPVVVFVADQGPILGVSLTGVRFEARAAGGIPRPQAVQVLNFGDPSLTINWTAALLSGSEWLSLGGGASGTATAARPGTLTLSPGPGAPNLSPGGRYALVSISDAKALNSPQYVVAVLDLAPASSAPLPDPFPAGLVFIAAGGAPPPQTVRISTSATTPTPFQAAAFTADGNGWLTAAPASGTASAQTPGQITASVNPAVVGPGIYTGEIDVAMSGVLRGVNVTLIVPPAGSAPASEIRAAACSPSRLAVTHTGMPNYFSVPAGWPATLIVQLNDDCGAPVLNGSVVANFSNGDPPLSLVGDSLTGTYSATWQPGKVASPMTVTAIAAAGALAPASAQLIGGVNPNQNPAPVLFKNGIGNNSYPVIGAALAPGTVSLVFGSGLASQTVSPGVVPLVTNFNGTDMLVGGVDAPLYYLSDGQLDIEIPFELTPNRQYQAIVAVNGALTLPETIDLAPVSPGVTAFPDGQLIAQHFDYSLVDTGHPAKPAEVLTMYLAGMGATNPSVPSAQPAPGGPYAEVTVRPTVTVDGQDAAISFAGLTPGGVGLYQINFQIPPTARAGNLSVVVTQGGVTANPTKILVSP